MPKRRVEFVDWIRGLAVLWVLVVHISLNYGIIQFGVASHGINVFTMLSFYMVPFYVISGYFFSKKANFSQFLGQKVKRLLIPYLTFSVFGVCVYEIFCLISEGKLGSVSLRAALPTLTLTTNTPCWFFISLFLVCIVYYVLSQKSLIFQNIVVCLCFLLAMVTEGHYQLAGYGNVLLGLVYFHMGRLLFFYESFFRKKNVVLGALALYIFVCIFDPQSLAFVLNIQSRGNYVLNFLFSMSAFVLLWNFAGLWKHDNFIGRCILFVGKDSLVLFAFHRPVLNWIVQPIVQFVCPEINYIMFLFISFACILAVFFVMNYVMKKFTPKLLGL